MIEHRFLTLYNPKLKV